MNKEIVIAAYDKELDWLSSLNNDVKIKIYRKGDVLSLSDNEIKIEPNKGRCVHTFFKHIHDNYENLSDITFFVQDFPFDHWENVIDVVNKNIWQEKCAIQIGGYYGFHFNTITIPGPKGGIMWKLSPSTQHGNGNILVCQSNGFPQDGNPKIDVNKYWNILFKDQTPAEYEFIPGGHFGITKDSAMIRSKEFYGKVVELLESDETAPWMIERLECYIFNKKYSTNE